MCQLKARPNLKIIMFKWNLWSKRPRPPSSRAAIQLLGGLQIQSPSDYKLESSLKERRKTEKIWSGHIRRTEPSIWMKLPLVPSALGRKLAKTGSSVGSAIVGSTFLAQGLDQVLIWNCSKNNHWFLFALITDFVFFYLKCCSFTSFQHNKFKI